jgi:hypothetical protein
MSSAAPADTSGVTKTVMSWFDSVVAIIPHDGTKAVLNSTRGSVESLVGQGTEIGATQAAEANKVLHNLRGLAAHNPSPLLSNTPCSALLVIPAAGACVALSYYAQRRGSVSVPSEEAGTDLHAPRGPSRRSSSSRRNSAGTTARR